MYWTDPGPRYASGLRWTETESLIHVAYKQSDVRQVRDETRPRRNEHSLCTVTVYQYQSEQLPRNQRTANKLLLCPVSVPCGYVEWTAA